MSHTIWYGARGATNKGRPYRNGGSNTHLIHTYRFFVYLESQRNKKRMICVCVCILIFIFIEKKKRKRRTLKYKQNVDDNDDDHKLCLAGCRDIMIPHWHMVSFSVYKSASISNLDNFVKCIQYILGFELEANINTNGQEKHKPSIKLTLE